MKPVGPMVMDVLAQPQNSLFVRMFHILQIPGAISSDNSISIGYHSLSFSDNSNKRDVLGNCKGAEFPWKRRISGVPAQGGQAPCHSRCFQFRAVH